MGVETTEKVMIAARVENMNDLYEVSQGRMTPDRVRAADVDARIDTRVTTLAAPASLITRLGLTRFKPCRARTADGEAVVNVFGMVRLVVAGRETRIDVIEVSDGQPLRIGLVPLTALDLAIDLRTGRPITATTAR